MKGEILWCRLVFGKDFVHFFWRSTLTFHVNRLITKSYWSRRTTSCMLHLGKSMGQIRSPLLIWSLQGMWGQFCSNITGIFLFLGSLKNISEDLHFDWHGFLLKIPLACRYEVMRPVIDNWHIQKEGPWLQTIFKWNDFWHQEWDEPMAKLKTQGADGNHQCVEFWRCRQSLE